MDDLVAFLRARLGEDEAEAQRNIGGGLHAGDPDRQYGPSYPDYQTYNTDDTDAADAFIVRFGPARVLREVAFKRAILAQWEHSPAGSPVLTYALYQLAAVYSDHLDYRAEWAPVTAGW